MSASQPQPGPNSSGVTAGLEICLAKSHTVLGRRGWLINIIRWQGGDEDHKNRPFLSSLVRTC